MSCDLGATTAGERAMSRLRRFSGALILSFSWLVLLVLISGALSE